MSERARASLGREEPVFLFDGDCASCTGAAAWVVEHLERPARALPWQQVELSDLGLSREEAERRVWWLEPDGRRYHSERAIAQALMACGNPWRALGRLIGVRGIERVAEWVYRGVARVRGRLPGPTPAMRRPGRGRPTGASGRGRERPRSPRAPLRRRRDAAGGS